MDHVSRAKPGRRRLLGTAAAAALVVTALAGCTKTTGVRLSDAPARGLQLPPESKARLVLNVDGARQATSAADWTAFRAEWEAAFRAAFDASGIAFVWQDGPARPLGEAGTLLTVHVLDYRYLPVAGGSAAANGPVGGAYLNAQLRFLSLADGRPFGERNVNTVTGAFSGPSKLASGEQIRTVAADVMRSLRRD